MTTKAVGLASDKLVLSVPRGANAKLEVRTCKHKSGLDYVDVRLWTRTWGADAYRPGKGVTLRLEELADVAQALEKAAQK